MRRVVPIGTTLTGLHVHCSLFCTLVTVSWEVAIQIISMAVSYGSSCMVLRRWPGSEEGRCRAQLGPICWTCVCSVRGQPPEMENLAPSWRAANPLLQRARRGGAATGVSAVQSYNLFQIATIMPLGHRLLTSISCSGGTYYNFVFSLGNLVVWICL